MRIEKKFGTIDYNVRIGGDEMFLVYCLAINGVSMPAMTRASLKDFMSNVNEKGSSYFNGFENIPYPTVAAALKRCSFFTRKMGYNTFTISSAYISLSILTGKEGKYIDNIRHTNKVPSDSKKNHQL